MHLLTRLVASVSVAALAVSSAAAAGTYPEPIINGGAIQSGTIPDSALVPPTNNAGSLATLGSALSFPHCLSANAAGKVVDQGTVCNYSGSGSSTISPEGVHVSPTYCAYSMLNGTTDTTSCVQAAITAACAQSNSPSAFAGGNLIFSTGAYYIKTGVSIPKACGGLHLVGQSSGNGYGTGFATVGNGTWIFSDNNCAGPIFNFYGDATQNYVYGGAVENMAFYNAPYFGSRDGSVSCKFPLIQANFGQIMHFTHLYAWLPYQLIKLVGGVHFEIDDSYSDQVLQDSPGLFEFTGLGTSTGSPTQGQSRQDQVIMRKVFAGASSSLTSGHKFFTGIWWHAFSDTLQIQNVAFEGPTSAMKIDCTGGGATDISACPAFLQAYDLESEGAGGNLIDAQDFQHLLFTDLYMHCFATYGGCQDGVKLYNNTFTKTYGADFVGGQIDSGQHAGLEAEMQGLNVSSMKIFNNNLASSGGGDIGIDTPVGSDLSGQINIVNNQFCWNAGNTLSEAAIIFSSGLDYLVATNNNFYGCGSGVTNNSGGTHVLVSPNVGP